MTAPTGAALAYPHTCATEGCARPIRYVRHDPETAHRLGRDGGYYDETGRTRPYAGTGWDGEHYHAPAGVDPDKPAPVGSWSTPVHFPRHTPVTWPADPADPADGDPELVPEPGRESAPLMRICSCGSHIDPDVTDDKGRISCETCGNYYDGDSGAPLPHPEETP